MVMLTGQADNLISLTHPYYNANLSNWTKWRAAYQAGSDFVNEYLVKFSTRESDADYSERKSLSYCPAFAADAIDKIKDSIYQRLIEIERIGGSPLFLNACAGLEGGVDQEGSSMTYFMGQRVLQELLVMGRVGIFVDMPVIEDPYLINNINKRPYLYIYEAEQIQSWNNYTYNNRKEYSSLLLEDCIDKVDPKTGLIIGTETRFRHLQLTEDRTVKIQYFDNEGKEIGDPYYLNLSSIPFILVEIPKSLMTNVADYQVALLNLASSDMNSMKNNFPFYTEQYDPKSENLNLKAMTSEAGNNKEIKVGSTKGRRYPLGTERPDFINPSPEPLRASMEKQEQLKEEIKQLVNATLETQIKSRTGKAKERDSEPLEAGLSSIGMELEKAENSISMYVHAYLNISERTVIKYPNTYKLKTDAERQEEAVKLAKIQPTVPSKLFQQNIGKRISRIMLTGHVTEQTLRTIDNQIDSAVTMISDAESIAKDLEHGIVDKETASLARGYPAGTAEKAKKDHIEELQAIAISQSLGAARGLPSDSQDDSGSKEKEGKPKRGDGKDSNLSGK